MNKFFKAVSVFFLIITIIILFAPKVNLCAQTQSGQIIVQGKATSSVNPNVAKVNFSIQTTNSNINEATTQNNNILSTITNYLTSINIEKQDIVTKNYYIYPKYNYSEKEEKFVGFVVDNSIEFKTSQLKNLAEVISKITSLGANRLNGVNFSYNDTQSLYEKTLKEALNNATHKAQILSNKELTISKIVEKNVNINDVYTDTALILAKSNSQSIFEGMVVVEACVEVTFAEVS